MRLFVTDIRLAGEMGFSGDAEASEDRGSRILYCAISWAFWYGGEMAANYVYSRRAVGNVLINEWMEEVFRDYNHPSIVAWTPINGVLGSAKYTGQR